MAPEAGLLVSDPIDWVIWFVACGYARAGDPTYLGRLGYIGLVSRSPSRTASDGDERPRQDSLAEMLFPSALLSTNFNPTTPRFPACARKTVPASNSVI
jgi:hypothetical protein